MRTIRELRLQRGWTQFQLALAVGVQPQTIYLWESGRRQPQVSQMRKLGQVFDLCSDEIDLERGSHGQSRMTRRLGESTPGREQDGRPVIRRADEPAGPHPSS